MPLGLVLLKLQQAIGIIYILIGKAFYITEVQTAIQTKDEGTSNIRVLILVMALNQSLNFIH